MPEGSYDDYSAAYSYDPAKNCVLPTRYDLEMEFIRKDKRIEREFFSEDRKEPVSYSYICLFMSICCTVCVVPIIINFMFAAIAISKCDFVSFGCWVMVIIMVILCCCCCCCFIFCITPSSIYSFNIVSHHEGDTFKGSIFTSILCCLIGFVFAIIFLILIIIFGLKFSSCSDEECDSYNIIAALLSVWIAFFLFSCFYTISGILGYLYFDNGEKEFQKLCKLHKERIQQDTERQRNHGIKMDTDEQYKEGYERFMKRKREEREMKWRKWDAEVQDRKILTQQKKFYGTPHSSYQQPPQEHSEDSKEKEEAERLFRQQQEQMDQARERQKEQERQRAADFARHQAEERRANERLAALRRAEAEASQRRMAEYYRNKY